MENLADANQNLVVESGGGKVTGDEAKKLLDAVIKKKTDGGDPYFKDYRIFLSALGDSEETRRKLGFFLRNVETLPVEVARWCEAELATN